MNFILIQDIVPSYAFFRWWCCVSVKFYYTRDGNPEEFTCHCQVPNDLDSLRANLFNFECYVKDSLTNLGTEEPRVYDVFNDIYERLKSFWEGVK